MDDIKVRRDEYYVDVDEDAGRRDVYDVDENAGRRDEYDVDEDAGGLDDIR